MQYKFARSLNGNYRIQTVRQGSSAAVIDIMTAVMGSTRIPDPSCTSGSS